MGLVFGRVTVGVGVVGDVGGVTVGETVGVVAVGVVGVDRGRRGELGVADGMQVDGGETGEQAENAALGERQLMRVVGVGTVGVGAVAAIGGAGVGGCFRVSA